MNCDTINVLKSIYEGSEAPVAVADSGLDILWKNSAAENIPVFSSGKADFLSDCPEADRNGFVTLLFRNAKHRFNIIKYSAEENYSIIEYLGEVSDSAADLKDYFAYLCARLRESAGQIAMAADDINASVQDSTVNVAEPLNRIDRNIMMLLNEAVVPEQLYYSADPRCQDTPVCIEQELALIATDTENALGRRSEVWQNSADGIFASMNKNAFETIVCCMISDCCCGELFPDKVEFSAERLSDSRASVSVRSVNLHGEKNIPPKLSFLKKTSGYFRKSLEKLMNEKYGAVFFTEQFPDGTECRMEFDALPQTGVIVRSGSKYSIREERFSSAALSLAETHPSERYKNIKMN